MQCNFILGSPLNWSLLTKGSKEAKDLSVYSVILFWTPTELVTPNRRKRGSWSEALGFTLLQLIWQVRATARLPLHRSYKIVYKIILYLIVC
jgi:hypothetical protein